MNKPLVVAILVGFFGSAFSYALDNFKAKSILDSQVGTSSTLVLNANTSRKFLMIENEGSQLVYVKVASEHSATEGVVLSAGERWEPNPPPAEAVYGKSASGTQTLNIIEGE